MDPRPTADRDQRLFQARLVRVLRILQLMQSEPREYTRADLAELFSISERQLDNDLRALRAAGYEIKKRRSGKGGYEIV